MELNELLAQVDALKAEIDDLRPLKPEVEHRIMQKFRLDWNYHSNAIEGNTLTLGETKAFLMEGLTASGKPLKDHLDIKGHNELIDFLQLFVQRQERLTEAAIREMHKILLREPYEAEAVTLDGRIVKKLIKLGEYKATPNFVRTGSGEIHQYAAPEDVAPKMAELITWQREQEQKNELHPVVQAAFFHHRFLAIHPFDDGNGRLGRILMNLLVMRAGFPPAVVKLSERDPYVAALRKADVGEFDGITGFIAQNVLDSESLYLRGAKGESIEDADDVDKAVALLKRELLAAPTVIELSPTIQSQHFRNDLIPLFQRLDTKLAMFDDLFAESLATLGNGKPGKRAEIVKHVADWDAKRSLVEIVNVNYRWNGFLRDGPNDFSLITGFQVTYEKRKFRFHCRALGLDRKMIYGTWLSEDDIKKFVTDFTKVIFDQIQAKLTRKKA